VRPEFSADALTDAGKVESIVLAEPLANRSVAGSRKVTGPLAANRFTRVYRGEGDAFPCPIAIKQFLKDPFEDTPHDAARAYHSALETLSAVARDDPNFGVGRPFGLIDRFDLVVSEWIDGLTLDARLLNSSPVEAQLAARKAGIWLTRLQRSTGLACRPMEVHPAMTRLATSIGANPRRSRGAVAAKAGQLLWNTADCVAATPVLWSPSHGDFKPSYLIMRDGRLFGIDLDLRITVPTVHDIAHFLNHLHLLFWSP